MARDSKSNQALFYQLTPDFVLDAVEKSGWRPTGEYFQLNSYENRVYNIRLENPPHQIIAKFYRPQRWSREAILEEHRFLQELKDNGVSAVPPLTQVGGSTLSDHGGLWFAAFPKAKGRMPQEFTLEELTQLGRVIARLHNVGALHPSKDRPLIDVEHMGRPALETIRPLLPPSLRDRYVAAAERIFQRLEEEWPKHPIQRIHGDCHRGNVLQSDEPGRPKEFFLIDFDDFGMGPPVQDLWMLFRHDEDDVEDEVDAFLAGYTELRDFDRRQLSLMTPLRGLRIISYAAWIARRWEDPSFPQIFPNFGTESYWFEELKALENLPL